MDREEHAVLYSAVTMDEVDELTTWTLAAIKAHSMALEGYCETQGCGQFFTFNVDGLIEGLGADWLVPEILPITCRECGGQLKFKLAMVPPEE